MGNQEVRIQERQQLPEILDQKIQSNLQLGRLKLSHQSNIWNVCHRLTENYNKWQISQIHLDNNMIAGEVIAELVKINFQKSSPSLKVLALSHNDIVCDHLKYFRGALFSTIIMLYLDNNKIGSDGCFYISKTYLPRLQILDLTFNLINENGAGHLATSNLPKMVNLLISNNQLTAKSLTILGQAQWPSLAFLQAKNNLFEPTKQLQKVKFRTEVKMFRLQIQ